MVFLQQGLPQRYSSEALKYTAYFKSDIGFFRTGTCFVEPPYSSANFDRQTCLGRVPGKPNYLLIGDSHAAQLWYGLTTVWPDINIQQLTAAGCPPLISQRAIASRDCYKLMEFAFNDYLKRTPVDRLLVVASGSLGICLALKKSFSGPVYATFRSHCSVQPPNMISLYRGFLPMRRTSMMPGFRSGIALICPSSMIACGNWQPITV